MSSDWTKVDFQDFINDFGSEIVVNCAPTLLFSKKDKEHEAYYSFIAFLVIAGGVFIYVSVSVISGLVLNSLGLFISIIVIAALVEVVLLLNYLKSNISIKLLESWVEIFKGSSQNNADFYCFVYYPIFSGKCHPNKAFNILYKLFQEETLKSKIDITQIEVYLKLNQGNVKNYEIFGYFFQYGEGVKFTEDNIDRNVWKFFPKERFSSENYIATANWDHQFEWHDDLALDFDKLHIYAPWVIKRWNSENLKPLKEEDKEKFKWDLRPIVSLPKLKPWKGDLENQTYQNQDAQKDLNIIRDAIKKIIKEDINIETLKDIKKYIFEFKAYFRDMNT